MLVKLAETQFAKVEWAASFDKGETNWSFWERFPITVERKSQAIVVEYLQRIEKNIARYIISGAWVSETITKV